MSTTATTTTTTTAVLHVTSEGERWDQLAYKYYGDPFGYERIIEANPAVAIYQILPPGISLYIPVIDQATASASTTSQNLPPWKQ
jgi:phage tail protein X